VPDALLQAMADKIDEAASQPEPAAIRAAG